MHGRVKQSMNEGAIHFICSWYICM